MKYTAEEVRARFEAWLIREHEYAPEDLIWQEKRNCYADYATHLAWNAYRDVYADLLERIKASEGMVPVAYQSKRRPEDYPDEWRECSKETFDTIKRMKDSPWIVRELFDRPPTWAHLDDAADKLTAALQENPHDRA